MSKTLFDENTFMGYEVNTRLFWLIFTLMMVFFTSPIAHLPYLLGYGILPSVLAGVMGIMINVTVPIFIAHRSWKKNKTRSNNDVLDLKSYRRD